MQVQESSLTSTMMKYLRGVKWDDYASSGEDLIVEDYASIMVKNLVKQKKNTLITFLPSMAIKLWKKPVVTASHKSVMMNSELEIKNGDQKNKRNKCHQ